jgi:hypothetical protein
MRTRGNVYPVIISVEDCPYKTGHVEVRIREKVKDISTDESSMFEYDEYTFVLADRDNIREDIEVNLADWIATGRMLEVNENATIICELREEIARLTEV